MNILDFTKLILVTIFVFQIQDCYGQDPIVVNEPTIGDSQEKINRRIEQRDAFINKYVDSLNSYKNDGNCVLPNFFTSDNFDQKNGGQFLISSHSPISLRKLIIDQVDNYEILWCVNDSNDPRVLKKDTSETRCLYCKIPFDQFSTQELVSIRLDELMNEKHLNKN